MPAGSFATRKIVLAVVCAVIVLAAAGGYWLFVRKHEGRAVGTPTCRIEFLSRDERLRREREFVRRSIEDVQPDRMQTPPQLPPGTPRLPYDAKMATPVSLPPGKLWRMPPATEADNPLLYNGNYAVLRFENSTGQPLSVYAIRGRGDKWPIIRNAFIVDVDVRDPAGGETVKNPLHALRSLIDPSLQPPTVPPAEELRQEPPPTFTIRPGEGIELPIRILNGLPALAMPVFQNPNDPAWRFQPGVYTVRATVSYAEAPGGEKKEVVSEPVKVAVTAEHIKAAEAFWNTDKK